MDVCTNCHKPKASFTCGLCQCPICKKCAQFVDENQFALMREVPETLKCGTYCGFCFDHKVNPELSAYEQMVERARAVFVFFTDDANETRLFKRDSKPIVVENCTDNEDALMKMAFLAVQGGYNALVDVEVTSEKVKLSGYQTSKWKARGLPVKIHDYIPNRKSRYIGNNYKQQ